MEAVPTLAQQHGLRVVEDAAHAPDASFAGRACGTRPRPAATVTVHYPPIQRFSRYEELGARRPLPLTDAVAPWLLTLPLYGRMRDEDVETVVSTLLAAV